MHPIIAAPPAAAGLAYWIDGRDLDGQANHSLSNGGALTSIVNKGTRGGTLTKIGAGATPASFSSSNLGCVSFDGTGGMKTTAGALLSPTLVIAQLIYFGMAPTGSYGMAGVDGTNSVGLAYFNNQMALEDQGVIKVSVGTPAPASQWIMLIARTTGGASSTLTYNVSTTATGTMSGTGITGVSIGAFSNGAAPCPSGTLIAQTMVWAGTLPSDQDVIAFIASMYTTGWNTRATLDHIGMGALNPTSPLHIVGGNKIVYLGDSLTEGNHGQPWYTDANTTINASVVTPCTFVNKGVGGDTIAQMVARDAAVIALTPDIVVIEGGVNDASLQATPFLSYLASCNQLLSDLRGGLPSVKMAWLTPLSIGEQIPDPIWFRIAPYCQGIAQVCAQYGVAFIPIRDMQQAYDRANNTPLPGNFQSPGPSSQVLLTEDGIHPSLATNGNLEMSNAFTARCTFSG